MRAKGVLGLYHPLTLIGDGYHRDTIDAIGGSVFLARLPSLSPHVRLHKRSVGKRGDDVTKR